MTGCAVMVSVNLLAAHAMGDRQRSARFEKAGKRMGQTHRIGEMRKGIVDNNTVELLSKICFFHISAENPHLRLRELCSGDFCHLWRDIDSGDRFHIPLQIIRNQHTCTAGYIQYVFAFCYTGIFKNGADYCVAANQLGIPIGSKTVMIRDSVIRIGNQMDSDTLYAISRYTSPFCHALQVSNISGVSA